MVYPNLPEWSKCDDLGKLVPSEIRTELNKFADEAVKLNSTKNEVVIGIEAGAFTIVLNGEQFHIDQEDDPAVELEKVFKALGCNVTVEGWY
jgi:hypothetical protein